MLAFAAFAMVLFLIPVGASAGGEKVDICHYDVDGDRFLDPSVPEWELLTVKDGKALETHLAHGDGQPGGEVPNQTGYLFDEDCVPYLTAEKIFAVAYIDVNASDGGYNAGVDTLIVKFVDGDGNGVFGAGDTVIRDSYPKSFTDLTTTGTFAEEFTTVSGSFCMSSACTAYRPSGNTVVLRHDFYYESYDNYGGTPFYFYMRDSIFGPNYDAVSVYTSPAVVISRVDSTDDQYFDVDIYGSSS
jgi:hypothetical protein